MFCIYTRVCTSLFDVTAQNARPTDHSHCLSYAIKRNDNREKLVMFRAACGINFKNFHIDITRDKSITLAACHV